jgi:hypothetical protein
MQTIHAATLKSVLSGRSLFKSTQNAWWLALLLSLCVLSAHAQFGSSLSGTVLDPSGAAIPNATVILTNSANQ